MGYLSRLVTIKAVWRTMASDVIYNEQLKKENCALSNVTNVRRRCFGVTLEP